MDRRRVAFVVPALNEQATIAAVVAGAARYGRPVVVDDGSTDATGEMARAAGAEVVRHPQNRGYDEALNSGVARALALGCDYIITLDADGQHDPTLLPTFVRLLDDGADVVIGVRDRHQRLAESLFALVARLRFRIRDPLCGMKGYRASICQELGHFDSYGSIGTELCLFAAVRGKRIAQHPVKTHDRVGAPRFGRRLSANCRIARAMVIGLVFRPIRWKQDSRKLLI